MKGLILSGNIDDVRKSLRMIAERRNAGYTLDALMREVEVGVVVNRQLDEIAKEVYDGK